MAGFVNKLLEKRQFDEPPAEVAGFEPVTESDKSFYERVWPVFACGAGLFSDGYLNGVSDIIDLQFQRPNFGLGHRLSQHYTRSHLSKAIQGISSSA